MECEGTDTAVCIDQFTGGLHCSEVLIGADLLMSSIALKLIMHVHIKMK